MLVMLLLPACSSVDTIAVQVSMKGEASGCQLFAFATTGSGATNGVPVWNYSIPDCTSDG